MLIRQIWPLLFLFSGWISAQENQQADSAFAGLPMQELQNAKAYYTQELDALIEEKKWLIQKGIEDGERLMSGADPKVVPEILIRLADLYYHQEKDAFLDRMKAYEDSLEIRSQQKTDSILEEPKPAFNRSLILYQKILDEYPSSDLVDDALYFKAFLFEEMGDNPRANALYLQLSTTFPQSGYLPEVYMRLGEYYFNPPVNNLDQANRFYQRVLQYQNSSRYYEALYKLGWSYYRLNQYAEAISYFTTLVDNFTALEKVSPQEARGEADLRNEAVEYIAVCFIDFGGAKKANGYLGKIGHPAWGQDVLKKMGDVYRIQKEEYKAAIESYELLLNYSAYFPDAPQIQKSIGDCYHAMGDPNNLFASRQKLFLTYQMNSVWWNKTQDEKSRLQAYKLGEKGLRENIFELIQKSENLHSEALYQKTVEMARSYLQAYPEDPYALLIRWNLALILDSKLHQYNEALQEYLTISLVYDSEAFEKLAKEKGLATIQDAALNAIVVADTLVRREYKLAARDQTPPASRKKDDEETPVPLSDTEKWQAMAYDNYIKLFPFDPKTPVVLANAGALFYTHNQYNEALKYFKTLTKNFPQDEQTTNVQFSILESYFGKNDFESVELLSRKLLGENLPADQKKAVEKKLAESIFLRAQTYSKQGRFLQAAMEYLRMALEIPTVDFADRAVFNAGREYDKLQDFASAIRAYEIMRSSYVGSLLYPDALNNLALNYNAVSQYDQAALCYEELSKILTDSQERGTAFYNAFVFYVKAENWPKAVETGKAYARQYGSAANAPAVFFKVAECQLQMKDEDGAVRTYQDLPGLFPNSALGVEAYFNAGRIVLHLDSLNAAEKSFHRAYVYHETLIGKGLEGNRALAVEGLFQASDLLDKRCQNLVLVLPRDILIQRLDEKQRMIRQLTEQYAKIASFQTARMPESLYRMGRVYEHFAGIWALQEVPPLDPTARAVKQKEINEKTARIFKQALSAYLTAARVMDKRIQQTDSAGNGSDSLTALTRTWLVKTRSKVSETLYRAAEINTRTIEELLRAPVPKDLSELAKFEYRSQVLLKAISPSVNACIEAHRRNLIVSDSLGFKGSWADSSRSKILSGLGLLAREFEKLSLESLGGFKDRMLRFGTHARGAVENLPEGLVNEMMGFLDMVKTFSQNAIAFRKNELSRGIQLELPKTGIASEKHAMVQFALRVADSLQTLSKLSLTDQQWAARTFEAKADPKFEEVLAASEDNVYFINENRKTVLEQAALAHSGFPDPDPAGIWLGIRLVQLDPAGYSEKFNIPVEALVLQPDSTWMCSFSEQAGWEKADSPLQGWIPFPGTSQQDTALNKYTVTNRMFIRKAFVIPGLPIAGEIESGADSSCRLFLNGNLLSRNTTAEPKSIDIKNDICIQQNILAVQCNHSGAPPWSGRVFVRYIPNRIVPAEK